MEAILKHKVFLVPARAEVVLWANRISFGCSALWSLAARCPSRGQSWRFLTCAWQPPQALSHLLFSVMLVSVLGAVVVVGLIVALGITLTDDRVVPMMYAERLPLRAAWRKLWKSLRAEAGAFTVYVLLRFVVSVVVGGTVLFSFSRPSRDFFPGSFWRQSDRLGATDDWSGLDLERNYHRAGFDSAFAAHRTPADALECSGNAPARFCSGTSECALSLHAFPRWRPCGACPPADKRR